MTKKPLPYAVAACTTLLASTPSIAQEAPRLEELIVTAQMRDENLNEVPISISVLGKEVIESSAATGLSQLEYAVPSINFGRGGRKSRGEIAIRGVGDFSRNIGTDSRVVVYIDDVPLGRSSAFDADLLDVEQIEVLRGPQGTLFGANTVSGAINITTARPQDERKLTLHSAAGNFDYRLNSIKADIPLSDTLLSSFQVSHIDKSGFIQNITLDNDLQGSKLDSAKIKLAYMPTDMLTLNTSFDWLTDQSDATNSVALEGSNGFLFAPDPREVAHNSEEFEKRKIWGGAIRANQELDSGATLVSISALRRSEFEELNEEDYTPAATVFTIFNEQYEQWSQETRYISAQDSSFDYVLGLYGSTQKLSSERLAFLSGVTTRAPGRVNTDTYALFAHGNYQLNERLKLSLGMRVQHEKKDIDFTLEDESTIFTNGTLVDKQSTTNVLPKIGLSYAINDSGILYSSISRGTKGGGWNADFVASLDNISFSEEFATNIEAGYKSTLFNDLLTLNLSAFLTEYSDFQIFQFVEMSNTTLLQLTNAGEVTSKGLELDTRVVASNNLSITFNAAYTDAVFDKFKNGGGDGIDYDNNTLPFAPEFTAFIGTTYTREFAANNQFSAHINYSYSDGYYSNAANETNQLIDNFFTLNGNINLRLGEKLNISLWGKNLSDELYLRSRDESFLRIARGYYEEPRSYGIALKYSI